VALITPITKVRLGWTNASKNGFMSSKLSKFAAYGQGLVCERPFLHSSVRSN
jgi:hypothetical protein